jgi:hypothetical protein
VAGRAELALADRDPDLEMAPGLRVLEEGPRRSGHIRDVQLADPVGRFLGAQPVPLAEGRVLGNGMWRDAVLDISSMR